MLQYQVLSFSLTPQLSGRAARIEQLWEDFSENPSQWQHNRFTKKRSDYSDFKHKTSLEDLWIDGRRNLPCVKAKIADKRVEYNRSSSRLRTPNSIDEVRKLCQEGRLEEALHMVKLMVKQTDEALIGPYFCLLKVCARRKALAQGKQVHALIVQSKCDSNLFLANNLIDMYSKCGSVLDAHKVFTTMPQHNIFSWTAIISAYADSGKYKVAIDLFQQLLETSIAPDEVAFVVVLKACASIAALKQGTLLHSEIRRRGFELNLVVQSALVDMYAKCGCLEDAKELFNNMRERNLISWTVMIGGYQEQGLGKEALALYERMRREGVRPDKVTFLVVLKACASIGALEKGKQLHLDIRRRGFESDLIVKSTLVDMYAKCGCLEDARKLFNNMSERNVVSWNAMIGGYGQNGLGREALSLYEKMKQEGVQPDEVTFICILSACSRSGLIDEGRHIFYSMLKSRNLTPTLEHYACVVDLLCRAGRLLYAENLIMKLPIQPDGALWMSLLGAAKNHGNVEIGKRAFDYVVKLEPNNPAPYLLLIDIYAAIGRMDEIQRIGEEMKDKGLVKASGCKWIPTDDRSMAHIACDASCLESEQIQAEFTTQG